MDQHLVFLICILLEMPLDIAPTPKDIVVDNAILPIVLKNPFSASSPDKAASANPPAKENIV